MDIHLRMLKTGGGRNDVHDLLLHTLGNLDNIAAVAHGDNGVHHDLVIHELDLYPSGHGLQADQLGQLRACGIGKSGNALHLGYGGTDHAGDHFFRNIDAAVFLLAGNIVIVHRKPPI